jgi:hypothetical protein
MERELHDMNRIRSSLLAVMLGATFLLGSANPAAAGATIDMRDTLILNADGSLTALVSYSCSPGAGQYRSSFVYVEIRVQQTKANATTSGVGSAQGSSATWGTSGTMVCNNTMQTAAVTVREQSGPGFATGKAFADVAFSACTDTDGCTNSNPDQFVRITK